MVKLQKLVLKNFKSFKNAEIPISEGFTAIVGANGSGKTNILDALMFAMGTTSLKTLRAGKLSELVNNTAMEGYAKVDLILKHNNERYEISRMIDRQGKSVCRLNSQRKTLNEISSLLGELGIKPLGHNIVVQGDSTRIIEMSSEERRQIIDELAGLQEFDEKKAEAIKNLEKVETKIKEAGIVMAERENYLQSLEKDRQAAMEFEQLQNEKKQATATILHSEIGKITLLRKENTEKVFSIGEEQNAFQKKISEEEAREREFAEKASELNSAILKSNENEFSNFGIKGEAKKAEKMLALQSIESRQEMLEKSNSRAFLLNEKIKALLNEKNSREKELAEIEKEMPQLREQIEILRKSKKSFEEKNMGKEQALKQIDREISAMAEEEARLQKSLFEKKAEISATRKEIEFRKQLLQESKAELEKIQGEFSKKESKKKNLDLIVSDYPNILADRKEALESLNRSIFDSKSVEARISETQIAITELKKQIANCPVCEAKLSVEKKKSLLEKKEDLLNKLNAQAGNIAENTKKLEEKKSKIESAFERKSSLEIELSNFLEIKQKRQLLEARIARITKELAENPLEQKEREAAKIEAQFSGFRAKKHEKELELRQFRAETGFEKASGLANSLNEAQLRIGLLEQKKNHFLKTNEKAIEEKKALEEEISQLKKSDSEMKTQIESSESKTRQFEKEILLLQEEMKKAEKATKRLIEEKNSIEEKISDSMERKSALQQKIRRLEQQSNELKIENSKLEVRLSDLSEEFAQFAETKRFDQFDEKQLQKRIIEIEKRIAELGAINMKAIESFNELKQEVLDVRQKLGKLEEERLAVMDLIQKIEVKRTSFFMNCFNELNKNFSKMFLELFSGFGQLSLSNPEKPLESGLLIEAKHKGNTLKNIDLLSGGEKTLAALAFLFAIQLYEPAPFYVFDEADAALDKQNSSKMVGIIQEMSKKSQFIIITHNDPLIQNANQIIGVALNKQKSSVVGLKLKEQLDSAKTNAVE